MDTDYLAAEDNESEKCKYQSEKPQFKTQNFKILALPYFITVTPH